MSLFQSNLRKQIRKLPKFLKFVKIIQSSPFSQSSFQIDPNSNEYLFAKFGFDTAENEPCKVCPIERCRSQRAGAEPRRRHGAAPAHRGGPRRLRAGAAAGMAKGNDIET